MLRVKRSKKTDLHIITEAIKAAAQEHAGDKVRWDGVYKTAVYISAFLMLADSSFNCQKFMRDCGFKE